jgi:formylglycine-generating enzyme required for sulfatase activity
LTLVWVVSGCARLGFDTPIQSDGPGPVPDTAQRDSHGADGPLTDGSPDGPLSDLTAIDVGSLSAAWVTIVGGTFTMGSPVSEPCRDTDEDLHPVTLTHSFEIQATEVTQAQFQASMGYNPAYYTACGPTCPVDTVSWHQSAAYCNALSEKAGISPCYVCSGTGEGVTCQVATTHSGQQIYACPGYRLPTEAEWEYAYRAGTTTVAHNGPTTDCTSDPNVGPIAWYTDNASTLKPAGQKQPNAWGLYDMAGNLWEWCHDWYLASLGTSAVTDPWGTASGISRTMRGGCWIGEANTLRAASREYVPPSVAFGINGFRCVRTL